jgi:hypothetical protein
VNGNHVATISRALVSLIAAGLAAQTVTADIIFPQTWDFGSNAGRENILDAASAFDEGETGTTWRVNALNVMADRNSNAGIGNAFATAELVGLHAADFSMTWTARAVNSTWSGAGQRLGGVFLGTADGVQGYTASLIPQSNGTVNLALRSAAGDVFLASNPFDGISAAAFMDKTYELSVVGTRLPDDHWSLEVSALHVGGTATVSLTYDSSVLGGVSHNGDYVGLYARMNGPSSNRPQAYFYTMTVIPEPATGGLLLGAAALVLLRRRRRMI